jgi:hypothetical protein
MSDIVNLKASHLQPSIDGVCDYTCKKKKTGVPRKEETITVYVEVVIVDQAR